MIRPTANKPPDPKTEQLKTYLARFFNLFRPSIELIERLIAARSNPQEIILLTCARLDALASSIAPDNQPNRTTFVNFVTNYSGHRDLMRSVSMGDLYYELGYHRWLAEGLIRKPGRVHKFSDLNDPLIELLDRSGIPLTITHVERFLTRSMRAICASFRCRPSQPRTKPPIAKPRQVIAAIRAEFQTTRDPDLLHRLDSAFQPLLEKKTVAAILYEKFRNNAVHGIKVDVDEDRFFTAHGPYWQPLYSKYYPPFFFVMFSAGFT